MPSIRIPFVGSITSRNSDPMTFAAKDQHFENCYPEIVKNPISGKVSTNLYKRLGTTVTATAGGSYVSVAGAAIWNSFSSAGKGVFPFCDATTLKLYDHTGAAVGTDITLNANSGAFINDTLISGVSNLTVLAFKTGSGVSAWFVPEGGSSTQITDGDFPTNVIGDFAHMDGYAFIMDTKGQIWNSDLNSLANWTATSVIPANSYADGGSGVARVGDVIAGLGRNSIEFFRNAGNPSGSPLSRVPNTVRRFRVLAQDPTTGLSGGQGGRAYMNVGDSLYFIGGPSDSGAIGIYRLDGIANPVKVSNGYVDRLLGQNSGYGACTGSFVMHGMTHAMFNVNTQNLLYCPETGFWWRQIIAGGTPRFISALGIDGIAYFGDPITAGKGIYKANPGSPVFQDDGSAFTQTVQTEPIDFGTADPKFIKRIRPVCDIQSSTSTLTISYSDDDYANFVTAGTIDLSSQIAIQQGLSGLGRHEGGRVWKFVHASNTPNRMQAMEIEYEVGA